MPLYFAYGANLDRDGMARRCPATALVGPGHLPDHRFIVMTEGYATVVPSPGDVVHGLLWDLAASDVPALDSYEDVEGGLYRKTMRPVVRGGASYEAMIYLATSLVAGRPVPGYMEAVLAAAARCGLPEPYRAELRAWLPSA